nr:MAG TPA: hypothetical protein [Bacteriophage sp.]
MPCDIEFKIIVTLLLTIYRIYYRVQMMANLYRRYRLWKKKRKK